MYIISIERLFLFIIVETMNVLELFFVNIINLNIISFHIFLIHIVFLINYIKKIIDEQTKNLLLDVHYILQMLFVFWLFFHI